MTVRLRLALLPCLFLPAAAIADEAEEAFEPFDATRFERSFDARLDAATADLSAKILDAASALPFERIEIAERKRSRAPRLASDQPDSTVAQHAPPRPSDS